MSEEKQWNLSETKRATKTINVIRDIVDKLDIPKAPKDKHMIPLSLGDPSFFGNLNPHASVIEAICASARSGKFNGYAPAHGHVSARTAIAQKYSREDHKLDCNDVVIASGCSDSLKIIIHSTVGEGDAILLPEPGFSLYNTLATNNFATCIGYPLLAEKQWECDLDNMDALVTPATKAILINNPSNPCGANYSRAHLEAIAAFALKHKLLIISDEVYGNMTFGSEFISMADIATDQPVVVAGGIAKQYCAPGWRLGWLIFFDKTGKLDEIHQASLRMSQLIVGCNTIIQGALPDIILNTPPEYYTNLNAKLERHATTFCTAVEEVKGLTPITPQGAMYVLVKIDMAQFPEYATDFEWCQALLSEEFVFVLPGSCFSANGFFRAVFCAPEEELALAGRRMAAFCDRHRA